MPECSCQVITLNMTFLVITQITARRVVRVISVTDDGFIGLMRSLFNKNACVVDKPVLLVGLAHVQRV